MKPEDYADHISKQMNLNEANNNRDAQLAFQAFDKVADKIMELEKFCRRTLKKKYFDEYYGAKMDDFYDDLDEIYSDISEAAAEAEIERDESN